MSIIEWANAYCNGETRDVSSLTMLIGPEGERDLRDEIARVAFEVAGRTDRSEIVRRFGR